MEEIINSLINLKRNQLLSCPSLIDCKLLDYISLDMKRGIIEDVEIIKFSNDGSKVKSKIVKISIGAQLMRYSNTTFQMTLDGDQNFGLKLIKKSSTSSLPTIDDLVNEMLQYELVSLYSFYFNALKSHKRVYVAKPFIIKFINRDKVLIGRGEKLVFDILNPHRYINFRFLPEFSHFVLVASNFKLVVVEIKGYFPNISEFRIHSVVDEKGQEGVNRFIENHKCTEICKYLNFIDKDVIKELPSRIKLQSSEFNRMGKMYDSHRGLVKAIAFFKKSASYGDSVALNNIGSMYSRFGDQSEYEMKLSLQHYKEACDLSDSFGLYNLGYLYEVGGEHLEKNTDLAIQYYKQSISLGNPLACHNLAALYDPIEKLDNHIPQDVELAIEYYEKAASMGFSDSLFNLGLIYDTGRDSIHSDMTKAMDYYQRSADLGDTETLYHLGCIYEFGKKEIKPNIKIAISYFYESSIYGNEGSQRALLQIFSK